MKKKLLSVLLATAMTTVILAGCGSDTQETTTSNTGSTTESDATTADSGSDASGDMGTIYLVSKGFQHQFWQAVLQGANEAAAEYGVTVDFQGPDTESDIAQQVNMLNNAINNSPPAIGLAALDTEACLEAISTAQAAGIPIIGFDSGVPGAPDGAIYATVASDNYAAGELAATETYAIIKDTIASATAPVRIGVMNQDATSASITDRGSGFIDKMKSLVEADGKVVSIEGHDRWLNQVDGADVVIDVAVPAQVTAEASSIDAQNILNKPDTICIFGSNQHSGQGILNGDANLGRVGADVVGVAFDSGTQINDAVRSGKLAGAVTQDPVQIGYYTVELCVKAANGEAVADMGTGCQWFTADNMEDPAIAPCLYEG